MSGCAESDVGGTSPARKVVERRAARSGVGGNFVVVVTLSRQASLGPFIHGGLVGIAHDRETSTTVTAAKRCIGLDREAVDRHMVGRQGYSVLDRVAPCVQCLLRRAEDEIDVDVFEPGCPRDFDRFDGLGRSMPTSEAP